MILINSKLKAQFEEARERLFTLRSKTVDHSDYRSLCQDINRLVKNWNTAVLLPHRRLDLHGMTPHPAVRFVMETVARGGFTGELTIICGQGHHSEGKIPRIKNLLLQRFSRRHIREDPTNPGRLLLKI